MIEERALAHDSMDASRVFRVREEMERAEARRLQPHYIESFFLEAFRRLGGSVKQREPRRYEVTHVPAPVRNRDRLIGVGEPVLPRYERIAFEKDLVAPQGKPLAAFLCPGHPLLDATIDLTLERHRDLLRRGAILVDDRDVGTSPRVLFYLEHAIQDASITRAGDRRIISKRTLYVELDVDGNTRHLQYAPYLDFRPLAEGEPTTDEILARPECAWVNRTLEQKAQGYAVAQVVPEHLSEVRSRRLDLIAKTEAAVQDRLTKEISYWDHRAEQLKLQEQAGKPNARLNSDEARKRADALQARLQKRMDELKLEKQIAPLPPVVMGGLLIVPAGLLAAMKGGTASTVPASVADTQASAAKARAVIMQIERDLGFVPTDRETEKLGYDIESRVPGLPAPRPGCFFVYVIECEDGSHYIGQTDDLARRWREHLSGKGAEWTATHRPTWLVHYEEFATREQAVKREHDLKTGFGRKWLKEEIAAGRTRQAGTGKLRFIEVKGRVSGAPTITVTKNEILYSLNKPDDFILAIVEFDGDLPAAPDGTAQAGAHRVHYVRRPFQREPDFGVTSVNYDFAELLQRGEVPR